MGKTMAMVDYLELDDGEAHLVAKECANCHAIYLDRRNACARCGKREFGSTRLPSEGTLRSYTIVHRAAPGIPAPYISALVDLGGGAIVKANLTGVDPDPGQVKLGMNVRMTTFVAGTDDEGTEAVAFAFEPA